VALSIVDFHNPLVIEVDRARYTKLPFAHTPPG
jgi:hypothetical protein